MQRRPLLVRGAKSRSSDRRSHHASWVMSISWQSFLTAPSRWSSLTTDRPKKMRTVLSLAVTGLAFESD